MGDRPRAGLQWGKRDAGTEKKNAILFLWETLAYK